VSILIIITRQQAISSGLKRYFTGKPCKYGHISDRYVSSFQCYECGQQPEYKARKSEITKRWAAANPERNAANHQRKYANNRESIKSRVDAWRRSNIEKANLMRRLRKIRIRSAGGVFTRKDSEEMFARQEGLCKACKCSLENGYHVDHIVPVKRGGSSWPKNIQLLCPPCNWSKSTKDNDAWLKERSKYLAMQESQG
jgi:5-methylcytosine-specific restriction endonuclease McrA